VTRFGTILRFDGIGDYGFITPDDAGKKIFVHGDDLLDDKYLFVPGTAVSFETELGVSGVKAVSVSLRVRPPVLHPVAPQEEAGQCKVLSVQEFQQKITEMLVAALPTLHSAQLGELRVHLTRLAEQHNWLKAD
jgi:CspA family cold shock protein